MLNVLMIVYKLLLPIKILLWAHPSFTLILISLVLFGSSVLLERGLERSDRRAGKTSTIAFGETRGELR
jgi:hypothetical protein